METPQQQDHQDQRGRNAKPDDKCGARKRYVSPRLLVHGTVADLTGNPGGVNTDGTGGSHSL